MANRKLKYMDPIPDRVILTEEEKKERRRLAARALYYLFNNDSKHEANTSFYADSALVGGASGPVV